jgi:CheY-like chemotaxis protein
MKILAADDDPIILEILSRFLDAVGEYDVTLAESAPDALGILAGKSAPQFDCFLLDIQMPGMDGVALVRRIREMEAYRNAPIMMLTALSEKRYIDSAFAAGATDYVTKPFDLTELRARINMAEQLVLSRKSAATPASDADSLLHCPPETDHIDLHTPLTLHDIKNVIACAAMENYVARLSRSSLFGSTVFAFALRTVNSFCDTLSGAEFSFLIENVAEVISDCLSDHQFLMTYAGNGAYVCITESGWRPDMAQMMHTVNLHLSRAKIMSAVGEDLHPRVSSGVSIRLVWKSGDQILNALGKAQISAETAALEFERLKTDFFQIGRTA